MKFEQFALQETQQLDEVRMGMSDLDLFIESPEAEGIKAGFEAELCFTGIGGGDPDYDSPEEDMDQDERATSISDICNFYYDGDHNGRREIQDLRNELEESWLEWVSEKLEEGWSEVEEDEVRAYIEENEWDLEDAMTTYMQDQMDLTDEAIEAALKWMNNRITSSREAAELQRTDQSYTNFAEARDAVDDHLEELISSAISDRDSSYDAAREAWEEDARDNLEENDWLSDVGVRFMSDVLSEFRGNVSWPHWTYPESESGFNEDSAGDLARTLRQALDVEVKVGSGYHSVSRNATRWIIEADSSLEADDGDMPAEIVSPPMPIKDCLQKMREFWEWAESEDAYTNSSTGLHVGVSLPFVKGNVDFVKLALFLGDKYVLEQFDRDGNHFCKSAFDKIKTSSTDENVTTAFTLLRKNLLELAGKALKQTGGHGKYTSINLKNDYIEFRSMGGDNYLKQLEQVTNTVKRYAYAMYIASRPDLHREEYAKKLYKMLSKSADGDSVSLFSQFNSGALSKSELTARLKERNIKRKTKLDLGAKYWWKVTFRSGPASIEVVAKTEEEAKLEAISELDYSDAMIRYAEATKIKPYEPSSPAQSTPSQPIPGSTADIQQRRAAGEFTGQWRVMVGDREVYRFGGVGNNQGDANRVAAQWLRNNGMGVSGEGFEVVPIMGNS